MDLEISFESTHRYHHVKRMSYGTWKITDYTTGEALDLNSVRKLRFDIACVFFPKGLGGIFRNLEELVVSSGLIKKITRSDFEGLEKLKILNLRGNRITELSTNVFHYLRSLEELHLEDNWIMSADYRAFETMDKLKVIGINDIKCNLHFERLVLYRKLRETCYSATELEGSTKLAGAANL